MCLVVNHTQHTRKNRLLTKSMAVKLLGLCLLVACVPLSLYVRVESKSSQSEKTDVSESPVTVRAEGGGKPYLNLKDGRQLNVEYRGDRALADALRGGAARALTLASADLDRNGTPDLVVAYSLNGMGLITVQRGNPDAFAPSDDSVFARLQQGYNPDSLLPLAEIYPVPVPADFLLTGNFTADSEKDVLFAATGGGLYLMAGDGRGGLGVPEQIYLPGPVTALSGGEFRAADGFSDIAVGIDGPNGPALLIFDDATEKFSNPLVEYSLSQAATAIEFGGLDDDPFQDVVATAGGELLVVHGWSRKEQVSAQSRAERVQLGINLSGLAVGEFAWDRHGRSEIAAMSDDGTVHIVQNAKLDARPFTELEASERTRGKLLPKGSSVDVESIPSWRRGRADGWSDARQFSASSFSGTSSTSGKPLQRMNLAGREADDLMLMGESQSKIEIVHGFKPNENLGAEISVAGAGDEQRTTLELGGTPVAALAFPKKLNGVQDLIVLSSTSAQPTIVPNAPTATITVDRTDDPSGAGLTAASACTAAGNDCSLRGAIQFANNPANNNTTISLPANTYILSINGTGAGGCDGNTVGDLGANQTMSIVGAGAATTIIRQTGTGPANDGDRVMCMNEPFTLDLVYNFSGFTMVGGRDGTAAGTGTALGGGGIIGGEKGNVLTLTNVVLANNQVTVLGSANIGGGGIQWTGGDMNVTNCTMGGSAAPGAYTDRTSTNTANLQAGSGGGIMFTPSAPQHTAATGILTVTGTSFSRNTAGSISSGGAGADLLVFAFAAPGGGGTGSATIGTSTFSNNSASPGNGGGILVESLATTVATTSLTNNSAGNRGGGIFVGGASLLLNGSTPSITFTGNTATNGGSSVSTSSAVSVSGTNTTIGGDIEVNTLGSWTNNTGSTLAPTNVVITGGTFNMNNSTMNVSGNLTIGPGPVVGSTFNGNTGTINIQGNFVLNAGGAPATTLNAGTGTFNFNGTGAQSITNGTSITFFNLTDSNVTQPLTLNNSINVGGTLNVNGANAILAPVAGAVIGGAGALTGSGTARVTRLGANAFLSQYTMTTKTLTNLTVEYIGAGAQGLSITTYGPLKINNSSGVTLDSGTATVNGLLTLANGALNVSTSPRVLVINNGTSVGSGSITSGADGTVNYNQSSAGQDVRAFNYGNLTFSGFSKVLASTGTIGIAGTFSPGAAASHTITGSTIDFNGTGAQSIPAFSFNNLNISGVRTTNSVTLVNGGTINIAGAFNPTASFTSGNYIVTNNTVNFNGSGPQTIPPLGTMGYFNLTSSSTGARTLQGSGIIGIQSVFTTGTNAYTATGSTVSFNGSALQSIPALPGSVAYNNLTLSNSVGANIATSITVGGTLSLSGGAFGVGTNTLTLNGAVTRLAGTLMSEVTGTVNYNQGSGGQATVLSADYGNLTFSNFSKTLSSTGVIRIAGVFTPGTGTGHTITGSTIEFSSASPQTIPGFTYNNLTSSSTGTRTLDAVNTIKIAGAFTPGTNAYTITGSTVEYNGTSAQTLPSTFGTYNNLTLNNAAGVTGFAGLTVQNLLRVAAGTFTSSSSYNNVQIDSGATLAGVNATTINISGNWTNNGGTFTPNGNTVNFTGTAAQTIDGTSATQSFGNITINKGSNGVTVGGSTTTLNINGNLLLTAGTFTAGTATAINVSGNWTNNTGSAASFVPGSSTVTFNNTVASQTIDGTAASQSFNHFAVNKTAQALGFGGSTTQLDVAGNFTLTSGTFTAPATVNIGGDLNVVAGIFNAPSALNLTGNFAFTAGTFNAGAAFNILGNWTNNGGTFNGGTGLVSFNGGAGQTISGTTATTFNNLTANDALGIAMNNDNTVNGILALTAGDITVAATKVLTQPAAGSSTGTFDVVGALKRTGFVSGGAALSFGNPFNSIRINSGTAPTDITVELTKAAPSGAIGFPNAINRTYNITPNGGAGIVATLRLHYLDGELNGNTEGAGLNLWQFVSPMWRPKVITGFDITDNWVEKNDVTSFSPWTMNSTNAPTATNGTISGRLTTSDGTPVAGAVIRLTGTQQRKTITDANGNYLFTGIETSGFYTVTPSRANYTFSPGERAFSQTTENTEAAFTATFNGDNQNPLDTAEYFVRQQYVDLLGREPDEGGFNYWSDRILECGANTLCVSARRRDVAAAFFIEQEFQQTGSFIYGLYKGALGRVPAYSEFSVDRNGLIVGPQLEALKQSYAQSFVGRPEFVSRYSGNTTAQSFVDALIANVQQSSGIDVSDLRSALITRYNSGSSLEQSRSFVVRDLTESAAFRQAEYNSAFVLTEYFGYLRRDPDLGGYAFWLNVLNNREPGNFRGMVCAFITSAEYQQRFSSIVSRSDHECGQ